MPGFSANDYWPQGKNVRFETVFSHASKLEMMQQASDAGYKVYLYFVSTESPEINIDRVRIRVKKEGHPVPENLIVSRYYRSLNFLYDAAQLAHQAYFFDNSGDRPILFAHFKREKDRKKWDEPGTVPNWFWQYYFAKVKKSSR